MKAVEALRIEVTKLQSEVKEQKTKEKELRMALGDTRAKLQEASRNFGVLKELADEYGYCRPELQIARMDAVEASQKIWQKTKAEVTDYFNEIEK
jgi:5-bromo-4-chloroindolyl phosphate hydrolysis protein